MVRYLIENNFKKVLRGAVGEISKEARILNIACEFDLVPDWLGSQVWPENVFGLELNQAVIDKVPNVKKCNVDLEAFPFPDESFDLVISVWGLEHFQTENVFQEIQRVLRPGGKFVFIVPNVNYPAFLLNKIGGGKAGAWYYRHITHSPYHPHRAYYKFNRLNIIQAVAKRNKMAVREVIYLGPAGILEYLSFSRIAQKAALVIEKLITNRWLYFFKPYFVGVLEK
jgi:SAM-dependent methyltransferase